MWDSFLAIIYLVGKAIVVVGGVVILLTIAIGAESELEDNKNESDGEQFFD